MNKIYIKLSDGSTVTSDFADQIITKNDTLSFLECGQKPEERRLFPLVNVIEYKIRDKWDTRPW